MTGILEADQTHPMQGGATFSLRHRLFRLVWAFVWGTIGVWTPTPMHGWRRFLVALFGARLATTAKIYPGVRIWYPPNLVMAEYSTMGRGVNCYCMAQITLEPYALVSQGGHLCGGSHDIDDPNFQLFARPILIGSRAWVAAEAFVGPGVTVGEGAVLGARSAAFKSLKPWTVYGGTPARAIRERRIHHQT